MGYSEDLRYRYPLAERSVVLDIGAHNLLFSRTIRDLFHCRVLAFEPIPLFYSAWTDLTGIEPFHYGIGAETATLEMGVKGDMSGIFAPRESTEVVQVKALRDVLRDFGLDDVDLVKINIEGGEFELLESMLSEG